MSYLIIGLLAVLTCIGLAVFSNRRSSGGRVRLANIAEGSHAEGKVTKLNDAAISGRFKVVKRGTDDGHIAIVAAATDVPLGICTDESSSTGVPLNVRIFGAGGTSKVLLGGTVSMNDELSSSDGTAIKLPTTTGTYYPFGRALQAGVSGDIIEVATDTPVARVVA